MTMYEIIIVPGMIWQTYFSLSNAYSNLIQYLFAVQNLPYKYSIYGPLHDY